MLTLYLTILPSLIFTQGIFAAPTPDITTITPTPKPQDSRQSHIDYNTIFEPQLEQQEDLYDAITHQNDIVNEQKAGLSQASSTSERVNKRQDSQDESFEAQLQQLQQLYAAITKANRAANEQGTEESLAKGVAETVTKRQEDAERNYQGSGDESYESSLEKRDDGGSFEDALKQLQSTYEQIEAEAEQLRTLVAQEGEILAAARQSVQ